MGRYIMEIQSWRELLRPYELAVDELNVKFNHIRQEHIESGLYSPIEQVAGRVKTVSSILDKAQRKDIAFEEIEEKIEDIAGIRIICQFVEDIQSIVELIEKRNDMTIKCMKDYIAKPKDSGYQSFHIIVYYTVQTINGPKRIPVEIQIRTLAMNFWAVIEHSLQYKYDRNIPEYVKERLLGAAKAVVSMDKEMSSVRNEIMDAQNISQIRENLVTNILKSIQNLYKVANKREVRKIQDEFYKVYNTKDIDQLFRFYHQLDLITEGYRAQGL